MTRRYSRDRVGQLADALDPARHHVTRLEVAASVRTATDRCARRNEVARHQLKVIAQILDDPLDREAHLTGPTALHAHAVDGEGKGDVGRIEVVGRNDQRTDRAEAGE